MPSVRTGGSSRRTRGSIISRGDDGIVIANQVRSTPYTVSNERKSLNARKQKVMERKSGFLLHAMYLNPRSETSAYERDILREAGIDTGDAGTLEVPDEGGWENMEEPGSEDRPDLDDGVAQQIEERLLRVHSIDDGLRYVPPALSSCYASNISSPVVRMGVCARIVSNARTKLGPKSWESSRMLTWSINFKEQIRPINLRKMAQSMPRFLRTTSWVSGNHYRRTNTYSAVQRLK